jgi:trehalose synthase
VSRLVSVSVQTRPLDRYEPIVGADRLADAKRLGAELARELEGRVVWNVNSTAVGGGVAEMLRAFLGYARPVGVDTRWVTLTAPPGFFAVTKRLHNALHGVDSAASFEPADRRAYEEALADFAVEFAAIAQPGDVAVLHDPQTAGLVPQLVRSGVRVIWRCHVGTDTPNAQTEQAWQFLLPYLEQAPLAVFSRAAYVPKQLADRSRVIRPSIDPLSPKNESLDPETVRSILVHVGLIEGPDGRARSFRRTDGSPGRVDRCADVLRLGRPPALEEPLVVQVSRWDRLKDPVGVMAGFERLIDRTGAAGAHLLLAGPNVHAVADDPEGAEVFGEVVAAWRALRHGDRRRVHLASLPTADVEENAVVVNALQRHASVVVQKSLREGFGLTVTEAMWKSRPVVASRVGGIQDQIEHGVHGLLIDDPSDPDAFAATLRRVLEQPELASELGRSARERVRREFLSLRSLLDFAALIREL